MTGENFVTSSDLLEDSVSLWASFVHLDKELHLGDFKLKYESDCQDAVLVPTSPGTSKVHYEYADWYKFDSAV